MKPVEEMLFLHSIGVPFEMHRSQFFEFAKLGHKQGFFQKDPETLKYFPLKKVIFLRQYHKNKKPGKTGKYVWHVNSHKPYRNETVNSQEINFDSSNTRDSSSFSTVTGRYSKTA